MERPNETIADIIAWLRKPREGENAYLTLWRDEIADRLEAAYKRESDNLATLREAIDYLCERMADMDATFDPSEVGCLRAALAAPATTAKSSAVGNCAKLREALERCRNTLLGVRDLTTNADIRNGVVNCLAEYVEPAISAPPRNCDRFGGDNAKLQKVYYSECGRKYDPQDPISRQTYLVGFGNWLLAPATEKEGGAK